MISVMVMVIAMVALTLDRRGSQWFMREAANIL